MTTPTLQSAVDEACAMLRGGGWNGQAERLRAAVEAKPISTIPDVADGHWATPQGREMAAEYATKTRRELCMGDKPDLAIANAVYMADRHDLGLIHYQTAAKERIRWLSVQLHLATERARDPDSFAPTIRAIYAAVQAAGGDQAALDAIAAFGSRGAAGIEEAARG